MQHCQVCPFYLLNRTEEDRATTARRRLGGRTATGRRRSTPTSATSRRPSPCSPCSPTRLPRAPPPPPIPPEGRVAAPAPIDSATAPPSIGHFGRSVPFLSRLSLRLASQSRRLPSFLALVFCFCLFVFSRFSFVS